MTGERDGNLHSLWGAVVKHLREIDRQAAEYWERSTGARARPEGLDWIAEIDFSNPATAKMAYASREALLQAFTRERLEYARIQVTYQGDVLCPAPAAGPLAREPEPPTDDPVDGPSHYGGAGTQFETISVLRAWLSPEEFRGGLRFNVIKYMSRAGKKKGQPVEQDLAKARFYLDALITSYEED